jgi:large subunit ribosomal protein L7e
MLFQVLFEIVIEQTFVKLSSATIKMLRLIEPYVAYGFPSLKSVRELIYKRGYGKVYETHMLLTTDAHSSEFLGAWTALASLG